MRRKTLLTMLAAAALSLFIAHQARIALRAAVPRDMPPSARFVQTGYDIATNEPLGQWIACRPSASQAADWCRVTDQIGTVVFEGYFLPVDSSSPVPAERLAVGPIDRTRLWTSGPAEQAPVPIIPLEDGQLLVPAADRLPLIARWANQGQL